MLGKGPARIYNLVSLIFVALSVIMLIYVVIRLVAG
jgi:hypothetical protein